MSDEVGGTPPEEKTPGTAHRTSATSRRRRTRLTETIDEDIPMGGLPTPGPAPTVDTDEERTHLTDMPEESEDRDAHGGHATTTGISNNKLAMWLFLGSECLLFGGLISTYMLYRGRHSGSLGPDQIYDIPFTSVSSFVLLMSSLTMVLAVSSVARGDSATPSCGCASPRCSAPRSSAARSTSSRRSTGRASASRRACSRSSFYTLTGLPRRPRHRRHHHAAVAGRDARPRPRRRRAAEVVELVGLYWHFVDIVWIVIFTLVYLIPA